MGDYSTSRIDDLPQLWDGFGKLVRKGLGIEAFGANIMDIPADYTTGPHDESGSGQEELYVALRGAGWVLIGRGRGRRGGADARPGDDGARGAGRATPPAGRRARAAAC